LSEDPIPKRIRVFPKVNSAVCIQDTEQQSDVVWLRCDLRHAALDRAVDLCYRPEKFDTDRQRIEYLFALYEKLTTPLLPVAKSKKARRNG
jgi:hypothetical protein